MTLDTSLSFARAAAAALLTFYGSTATDTSSQLARCDVVSARLACNLQEECYLSAPITTAVARTLEPSDLMLICCLSAGWLVSRLTNSLAPHCCCWSAGAARLAGQGITCQPSAHSIVDSYQSNPNT